MILEVSVLDVEEEAGGIADNVRIKGAAVMKTELAVMKTELAVIRRMIYVDPMKLVKSSAWTVKWCRDQ